MTNVIVDLDVGYRKRFGNVLLDKGSYSLGSCWILMTYLLISTTDLQTVWREGHLKKVEQAYFLNSLY